ncbi:MAG: cell division protein ZipA [Cellvibrionaceae bacterium]
MREWLTVIIVLLIITVILDGLRRMRANRKSSLKMSLSMHQGTTKDDLDDYGSELPNGGARVIDVRDENHAEDFNKNLKEQQVSKRKIKKPYRIPQQVSLSLDEHVPMLMESVDDVVEQSLQEQLSTSEKVAKEKSANSKKTFQTNSQKKKTKQGLKNTELGSNKHSEPDVFDELGFFDDGDRVEPKLSFDSVQDSSAQGDSEYLAVGQNNTKNEELSDATIDALNDELEDVLMTSSNKVTEGNVVDSAVDEMDRLREELRQERETPDLAEHHDHAIIETSESAVSPSLFNDDVDHDVNEPELEAFEQEQNTDDSSAYQDEEDYSEPEDVLVINVMAAKGEHFQGKELLNVVLSQGMRFGSMNIFHHHEDSENDGCILYSMANLVKPGTFDLNAMSEFSTPGVSLFMPLPLESDSLAAFEKMVATARAIAIQLYGDLKDENRSVFTKQTIEHYRSRIQEFERKHRLKSHA